MARCPRFAESYSNHKLSTQMNPGVLYKGASSTSPVPGDGGRGGLRSRLFVCLLVMGGMPLRLAAEKPMHWAFVPPRRPAVPSVRLPAQERTPIDHFVEAA